jgi:hypothetical protein
MSRDPYALSDHRRIEYRLGETPVRRFLTNAPRYGLITFTRLLPTESRDDARGRPGQTVVELVDEAHGRTLLPAPIVLHSPSGFEWGFGGSGPADLAANVLAVFVTDKEAMRLHQRFKEVAIARIDRAGGRLSVSWIRDWLGIQWALETRDAARMADEMETRRLAEQLAREAELEAADPDVDELEQQEDNPEALDLDDVSRRVHSLDDADQERR